MTKAEARTKGAVFLLHSRGIFPSPSALADFLEIRRGHWSWLNPQARFVGTPSEYKARGMRVPSGIWQDGRTARWRREALEELGYRAHILTGRFHPAEVVALNPRAYMLPTAVISYRERVEELRRLELLGVIDLPRSHWAAA